MMKSAVAWGPLAVVLLLGGCTEPSASMDPKLEGTMTITPASAEPSQQVELKFPGDSERGIAFSLSQWSDGDWEVAYYLTSDWGKPEEHQPTWWPVEDSENRGWEQVGISGTGPDRVLIPDTTAPGDYLLCTANALDEACAQITITS